MERKQHLDGTAVAILLGCCLSWGLNQVAAKTALTEIGPLWQAALRSGVAGVLVWLFAAARGIALFRRDGSLPGGMLAGLLFAAEFACIFVGLQYTTASRMVVFLYLSPFVVALGMPLISPSEKLTLRQTAGLVIAFGAVAFAFGEGLRGGGQAMQWLGDALGVLAALLWAGTTLAIRGTRLSTASAEKTLLYQLAVSALALGAGAVATGEILPLAWSWRLLGLFAFQAVIVSFVSYLLWFWLIRHYVATRLSSFTLSTPLFGLLAGALLLGEPITPRLMLALAGLAVGIVMVNR
ncbi:EamA family transporter [Roseateles aquatilis]|uniref:EamA family transporter n=1 Tax=Roseateles aquatilis TaxID=431061 RepID=A0A2D0AM52_9BURK|nr:DMT family transporter [Roseateles aquatilis]OWQ85289.1 EamA family transporter [Roseateles aquatilis]